MYSPGQAPHLFTCVSKSKAHPWHLVGQVLLCVWLLYLFPHESSQPREVRSISLLCRRGKLGAGSLVTCSASQQTRGGVGSDPIPWLQTPALSHPPYAPLTEKRKCATRQCSPSVTGMLCAICSCILFDPAHAGPNPSPPNTQLFPDPL